jgi:hypothetical protein
VISRSRLVFALVAGAMGCSTDSPSAPLGPEPATISMYLSGIPISRFAFVGMLQGDTLKFAAALKTHGGLIIPTAHPTLVSRNPSIISLNAAGTMRAVGRGNTWLVAGYNSPKGVLFSDSISVGLICTSEPRPVVGPDLCR